MFKNVRNFRETECNIEFSIHKVLILTSEMQTPIWLTKYEEVSLHKAKSTEFGRYRNTHSLFLFTEQLRYDEESEISLSKLSKSPLQIFRSHYHLQWFKVTMDLFSRSNIRCHISIKEAMTECIRHHARVGWYFFFFSYSWDLSVAPEVEWPESFCIFIRSHKRVEIDKQSEVKFALQQVMKTQRRSEGISLLFLKPRR
jgi:hypothetical protein